MLKFIPGKEVLDLLGIRDFQLLELVKKGRLQPYDKFGKIKLPFNKELEIGGKKAALALGEKTLRIKTQFWKSSSLPDNLPKISKEGLAKIEKSVNSLKKELFSIRHSGWTDYDLPSPRTKAEKDLKYLVDSLFLKEEVQKLGREHGKESQTLDVSTKEDSQELTELKEEEYLKNPAIIQLVKEANQDTKIIYHAIIEHLRSIKVRLADSTPSDLQQAAKHRLNDPEYTFKWMKEKYLEDLNFFTETRDSTHPRRYFRETMLREIIKENTPKKDITIPQIRKLLKKIHRPT